MEMPGSSIFQGASSFQLNNSANHVEEEEALEDQKRRDEELGDQLQNAFDDLIDDDEYTVDSSTNFQSRLSNDGDHEKESPIFSNENLSHINILKNCTNTLRNNDDKTILNLNYVDKLKKTIESKNRELENLTKMIHEERKKSDDLTKRLALSEAEKSRAQMSKQQTHELLVETKANCLELEDVISKLKSKVKFLEENNTKLEGDLERIRHMFSDVQNKYHIVEKNAGISADRNAEILMKKANDRNNAQIEMMHQQINNLRNKLEDKELEVKTLDTRYKELQKSRETLLIDKAETINQLSRSLEESQRQCQQLISNQDYVEDNIRLKRLVTALQKETDDMQKTINSLRAELETTTTELNLVDSILHENNISTNTDNITSLKGNSLTKLNLIGSTPLSSNDRIGNLKTELYRCMSSQKTKRDDIKKLHEQLASNKLEIKNLKDEENKNLVQITMYKEEKDRLENRIKIMEEELEQMKNANNIENNSKIMELELLIDRQKNDNLQLEKELKILRANNVSLIEERNQLVNAAKLSETEHKEFVSKLKNLNIDLEELKQEHESMKMNNDRILKENEQLKRRQTYDPLRLELEKQKYLLKDSQQEADRIKNLYVDISNVKENLSIELAQLKNCDLYKELQEEKMKCINLERGLQLVELKCSETMKLLEIEKTAKEQELCQLKEQISNDKLQNLKSPTNTSKNCLKCIEHISDVAQFEIQNLRLEKQCSQYERQILELQSHLAQAQENVAELTEKISLKIHQDKLIVELKNKAEQFENFIKLRNCGNSPNLSNDGDDNNGTAVISPKNIKSQDQNMDMLPALQNYSRRQVETRIRDEMAKIFAIELKNMEDKFQGRLNEFETENNILKQDIIKINSNLKLRQNEVQLLKHAILSEREKTSEIFKNKDTELQKVIQKQSVMLHKCQDELKLKERQLEEIISELEERNFQIEGERQSMKAVMTQWEEQRKHIDQKNTDWVKTIENLKKDHISIIAVLKQKYESAKMTANNYKRYAEEKEKHMLQEYDRIKAEYSLAKNKLENRYHEFIEGKSKEMKSEIANIKLEYDKKLTNLDIQSDFAGGYT